MNTLEEHMTWIRILGRELTKIGAERVNAYLISTGDDGDEPELSPAYLFNTPRGELRVFAVVKDCRLVCRYLAKGINCRFTFRLNPQTVESIPFTVARIIRSLSPLIKGDPFYGWLDASSSHQHEDAA